MLIPRSGRDFVDSHKMRFYWTAAAAAKSLQSCPILCDPHRRQPTRLPRPWDSPGKNTGVGCHFLLQRVKVKSESEVAQSRPTPSDPMDCSPPGSPIHGIFQAKVLEWGAIALNVKRNSPFLKVVFKNHFLGESLSGPSVPVFSILAEHWHLLRSF